MIHINLSQVCIQSHNRYLASNRLRRSSVKIKHIEALSMVTVLETQVLEFCLNNKINFGFAKDYLRIHVTHPLYNFSGA